MTDGVNKLPGNTPEEQIAQINHIRELGQMESLLDDKPSYILMAYQLYPNGSTSPDHVTDPRIARAIGAKMDIGDPSDPNGWGIWEVGEVSP